MNKAKVLQSFVAENIVTLYTQNRLEMCKTYRSNRVKIYLLNQIYAQRVEDLNNLTSWPVVSMLFLHELPDAFLLSRYDNLDYQYTRFSP